MDMISHATPAKKLHWLSSVFCGILMCKIVYDLTGAISASFFKGYNKLNNKEKLEWNNKGFSTFHAIAVATGSLYLLLFSDLFVDGEDVLFINRSSTLSDTIMGVSIGYFLSDLALILYHYPALGGMEYILHHGLSMVSIIQSLLSGQAQFYIFMVLFTEITTPFVNLRWHLDVAGLKNSKLYIYNGVALFFGWLVARIILFAFLIYHMFVHFDQVTKVFPLGFYSLMAIPPVLSVMNIFWFWKIARGDYLYFGIIDSILEEFSKVRLHSISGACSPGIPPECLIVNSEVGPAYVNFGLFAQVSTQPMIWTRI